MAATAYGFDITSRIITLVIMMLSTIFSIIAGITFIYLFYKYFVQKNKKFNIEVHSVLGFYKAVEIVNSMSTGFYLINSCVLYRIDENKMYGNMLLFWTSALYSITSVSRAIAIFVLGLDKVCVILFTSKINWRKKQISILIGPALMIVSTLFLFVYRILPNFPEQEEVFCPEFSCLTQYGYPSVYLDLRVIFAAGNLIVAIVLLILILKKDRSQGNLSRNNSEDKWIFSIMFLSFGFELIPHIFGIIYQRITLVSLVSHIGPYPIMLTALESIFCGLVCVKMFSTKKIVVIQSVVKAVKTVY
ncbi:hypothetical protein FO519_007682 [Halicephalobus sp. NKZ332]|nr:hypothetical protein FO519_007682 [Halicephalobus sp. NKZ332]